MKSDKHLFVIRKYIMAENAHDAIKKDKTAKVDDVYIDGEWQSERIKQLATNQPIGYKTK